MDKHEIIAELKRDRHNLLNKINFKGYNPLSSDVQAAINVDRLLEVIEHDLHMETPMMEMPNPVHEEKPVEQQYEAEATPPMVVVPETHAPEIPKYSEDNNFIVDELKDSEKYFEMYKETKDMQLLEIAKQELSHAAYWLNKEHMRAKTPEDRDKLKVYQKLYMDMKTEFANA